MLLKHEYTVRISLILAASCVTVVYASSCHCKLHSNFLLTIADDSSHDAKMLVNATIAPITHVTILCDCAAQVAISNQQHRNVVSAHV
jgi:hypothetical protein